MKKTTLFSSETLEVTARLSRLRLSKADAQALVEDLAGIIAFVDELKKAAAGKGVIGIEEPRVLRTRPDSAPARWPLADASSLMAMTPRHRNGFLEVPHVFSS